MRARALALLLTLSRGLAQWRLCHFGDPQIGFGNEGLASVDAERFRAAAGAASSRCGAVAIAGDLLNVYGNATQLAAFKTVWPGAFGAPPRLVPGNHDVESMSELSAFRSTFGADYGVDEYTLGDVRLRVVAVDSEAILNLGNDSALAAESEAQWAWLNATLTTTPPASTLTTPPASNNTTETILLLHHPPFITSEDEADQYYNWPPGPRARFLALVRGAGVRHLLCGHTHTTTTVSAADAAFTVYTVGGTARIFDDNGFGYSELTWNASARDFDVAYQRLDVTSTVEECVDVFHGHPYPCRPDVPRVEPAGYFTLKGRG